MTRATSKKEIEKKVLGGVLSASSKYIRISGNVSLCDAPEYFLTVSVAESLSRGGKNYVTLEHKVKEIIKYAGGTSRGQPSKGLRRGGRSDIVIWHKTKLSAQDKDSVAPRVVIEIKHPLYHPTPAFKKDVKRLGALLKLVNAQNRNSIQFCCLAFWTGADKNKRYADPAKTVNDNVARLKVEAEKIIQGDNLTIRQIAARPKKVTSGKYTWAWSPACLIIERTARSRDADMQELF